MMKSIALLVTVSFFSVLSASASYNEVQCSTDAAFDANACNQCFVDSEARKEGDTLGLLTDKWENNSNTDQLAYKEEITQTLPEMKNLAEGSVSWKQNPGAEGFWETTQEFNALYSQSQEGYVLKAGQSIDWLKSKLGYGYTLEKNMAPAGTNIGLLVYPFTAHVINGSGSISLDDKEHRECVLYKSDAVKVVTPEVTETPAQLPKTGPEHIILLLVAMLIGTGLILFRKKA